MPKRRKYSPEFKKGAVEQVRQPGVSCAQVARELGIGAITIIAISLIFEKIG